MMMMMMMSVDDDVLQLPRVCLKMYLNKNQNNTQNNLT